MLVDLVGGLIQLLRERVHQVMYKLPLPHQQEPLDRIQMHLQLKLIKQHIHEFLMRPIRNNPQPPLKLLRKRTTQILLPKQHPHINKLNLNLIVVVAALLQKVDCLTNVEDHQGGLVVDEVGDVVP